MKKKYYIIYEHIDGGSNGLSKLFTIVEDKDVADDWCNRNPQFYYVERTCE